MKNMQKMKFLTLALTKKKEKKNRDERGTKTYPTSNTLIHSRQVTENDSVVCSY